VETFAASCTYPTEFSTAIRRFFTPSIAVRKASRLISSSLQTANSYGVFWLVTSLDLGWLAWDRGGPYAAGAVVVAAGLYELTPLKQLSLGRCRHAPHSGDAFRSGLAHGLDCVGCSGALMAVLFALGAMSLVWMAVVGIAIFAEKVLPPGERLAPTFAVALVALGLWVAVSPASVPGLTEPGRSPAMEMTR